MRIAFFELLPDFVPLFQGSMIEKPDQRISVMLFDHVHDLAIHLVLDCHVNAVFDVRHDDESAHVRRKVVMRIMSFTDVFDEIGGFFHLPDIVKISTNPTHDGAGTDRLGRRLRERRNDETVMVGSRCLDRHLFEQGMVQVRQLDPRDIRGDAESRFHER
jgi:hypothetical protein